MPNISRWFLLFFFVSGYCSLVYEVVWLRLGMAGIGVNAPIVSLVLSVFMAGLGLGSYGAGRLKSWLAARGPAAPLRAYALCEALIGVSGLVVAPMLKAGQGLLISGFSGLAWGSSSHYLVAGLLLTLIILPWTACMGATFPLAMAGLNPLLGERAERSFSFLYVANLLGAAFGTLASAFVWIELFGFQGTLYPTAALNLLVAALAWGCTRRMSPAGSPAPVAVAAAEPAVAPEASRDEHLFLLAAGFASMGIEVVWIRLYTPFIGTTVYAFASILALYLLTNFAGSLAYRRLAARARLPDVRFAVMALGPAGLFALIGSDPTMPFGTGPLAVALRVLLGVTPFAFLMGLVTPCFVDRACGGEPRRAGTAYAYNILGCIVGPLAAGFALLPLAGEKWALVLFCLAFFGFGLAALRRAPAAVDPFRKPLIARLAYVTSLILAGVLVAVSTTSYERCARVRAHVVVLRDFEATTVAFTSSDGMKNLLVNGVGMTVLTPITKFMAHMPLTLATHPPRKALVICFGMGTTFRSALTWGLDVDSVDLVPAVPLLFEYFHTDAAALRESPRGRMLVDDGRRFLARTNERYDLIMVDPPPPFSCAASGLLYSVEFCQLAKARLTPGGILMHWLPGDATPEVASSVARALQASFPHVRAYSSVTGWGIHFLASDTPIPVRTASEMAQAMPPAARADLVEWGPEATAEEQFAVVLSHEIPMATLLALAPDALPLTDDRPVNEYFAVRHRFPGLWQRWQRWLKP